jgi:hypothetical protein
MTLLLPQSRAQHLAQPIGARCMLMMVLRRLLLFLLMLLHLQLLLLLLLQLLLLLPPLLASSRPLCEYATKPCTHVTHPLK